MDEVQDLYRIHARKMKLLLLRRGCREDLAEDLVQDAFLKFLDRVSRGRIQRVQIPGILFQMAHFLFLTAIRSRAETAMDLEIEMVANPSSSRDDEKVWNAVVSFLKQPSLSPRQKKILILRFFLEITEVEIAKQLHIARNTVRREWREIAQELRKWFDKQDLGLENS